MHLETLIIKYKIVTNKKTFTEQLEEGFVADQPYIGIACLLICFCFILLCFTQERAVTESQHAHI